MHFQRAGNLLPFAKRKPDDCGGYDSSRGGDKRKTRDELVNEMFENLLTMQKSIRFGLEENQQTVTGLAGGNAEKLMAYAEKQIWAGTWHKSAPLLLLLLK